MNPVLRTLATVALVALAVPAALAAERASQGEPFALRDREGRVVGAFSPGDDGRPGIVLFDRDGTVHVVIDLGDLASTLRAQEGADAPRTLRTQAVAGEPREAPGARLPYGAAILAVALLAAAALVLFTALVILDRRSLRSAQQFHELWVSAMHDRDREREAYREALLSHRHAAAAQRETLDRCEDVGADVARTLERVRGEIDEQLRRLRRD